MSGPTPDQEPSKWWRRPYSNKWRSWDMAVTIAIVLPLVSVPIWLDWPWWTRWLAPVVFVVLLYIWIRVRLRLAGLDPNKGEEKNRGAQI
jgi:hypothetical protein